MIRRPFLIRAILQTLGLVLALGVASSCVADPIAQPFLHGILTTKVRPHSSLAFSPDGASLCFSGYVIGEGRTEWMFISHQTDSGWTAPLKAEFNSGRGNGPVFSPNGTQVYFGARGRLEADGPIYNGIWYVERSGDGYGEALPVTGTLDTLGFAGRPSFTESGDLYYVARGARSEMPAIFVCRPTEAGFGEPQIVTIPETSEVLMDPWIEPHGRFLLFMQDYDFVNAGEGSSDLYTSFRNDDDSWSAAINLGPRVNTEHFDRSPSLNPDGSRLIFIRAVGDMFVQADAHYFQVDAEILDSLRP